MVRLRHAVMAAALGTGAMGCTLADSQTRIGHYSPWHCDECDNFPMPAYGPGASMMPGSYTRLSGQGSLDPKQPASDALDNETVPPPHQMPAVTPPPPITTPPAPPAAAPGLGVDARRPAFDGPGLPDAVATRAESNLPALPAGVRDDLQVPVANP
jgi:hypothetical protein